MQRQLSEYSAYSVVQVALEALAETKPWTLQDIQSMPWLTLLVVKWSMQCPNCRLYLGKKITRLEFDGFRQRAWDLTGLAKAQAPNAYAMIRSILAVQIEFQRRSPWGFMRWACLIARLTAGHPSRVQFEQSLQLSPEEFIDACWILQPPIVSGNREIDNQWIENVAPHYKVIVNRLLNLLGTDFLGLRDVLSQDWQKYSPNSWELFELPFARKLPFLLTSSGNWRIWHPAMVERALEAAVHLTLTPLSGEYTQVFSRVFEDYVVELAKEAWHELIDEAAWKREMGHNSRAVEGIVPLGAVNIFIEAKMSLFHDAVITDDSPENLTSRLERVIEAVRQCWKVSQMLRHQHRKYPRRAEANEEFLLIVTSRELNIGGGLALQRLLPPGTLVYDDYSLARRLPPENIFVLSIESFEHFQGIVRDQNVDVANLLRASSASNRDPGTSTMYFDDHLRKYKKGAWPVVGIEQAQREASVKRLESAFSVNDSIRD